MKNEMLLLFGSLLFDTIIKKFIFYQKKKRILTYRSIIFACRQINLINLLI